MIVYAAVDLRGGRAVQLVGGDPAAERVSRPDAVKVAREWVRAGMRALHVIDLDAAMDRGSNAGVIRQIISAVSVPVQVGGGVREEQRAAELLAAGAARVVLGTRAVEDAKWRRRMTKMFPDQIIVAADMRNGNVVTRGWTQDSGIEAEAFVEELNDEAVAAVLVTDVTREGQMVGVDVALFEQLIAASHHPLIAAGGLGDVKDVKTLARLGVAGVVLGMALYTGRITPQVLTQELRV
jgi:phosphoribosylformimino-5-aminoimidazole carboxamide ribotide isomerase